MRYHDYPQLPLAITTMSDATPELPSLDSFLEEKSFKSRYVLITGEITHRVANDTTRRLLALSAESDAPINVLISTPGGHVESGDMIHDVVQFINCKVNMIGTGWVASAGVHIYLSVPRERRFVLKNTRFLIHQPTGGAGGQASDIAIQAREIVKMRERIAATIAQETGNPLEKVLTDIDRDYWMTADEAIAYGLASRKIIHSSELG